MKKTYKIIRHYRQRWQDVKVVKTGLTLKQAQEHCSDPKTRKEGVWFDGYTAE